MTRTDLVRQLSKAGCVLKREGPRHKRQNQVNADVVETPVKRQFGVIHI